MVKTEEWIKEGWEMVKENLFSFIGLTLLYLVILALLSLTYIGTLIVGGPLLCGYFLIIRHLDKTGEFDLKKLWEGFNFFLPGMLAWIVIGVFTSVGAMLCLIPGIVVSAVYIFTYLFIIDKGLSFWDAMEASRRLVFPEIIRFSIFTVALVAINLLGALACLIGMVVTLPITICAIYAAYKDLVLKGEATQEELDTESINGGLLHPQ
jgi:uncharacterized membrane protein